jgi:hypothetical protein
MRLLEKIGKIRQTPENMAIVIIGAITLLLAVNKIGYVLGWLFRKTLNE